MQRLMAQASLGFALMIPSLLSISVARSQEAPCGVSTVNETTPLLYPPVARQAHVTGRVILLASYNLDGSVASTKKVSGPAMLEAAATTYVKGWQANPYTGPRECPIVIDFEILNTKPCESSRGPDKTERSDLQHVVIGTNEVWLCDPPLTITRHKRFWLF